MPFRSKSQARYMFKHKPEIATKWVREYGMSKDLPEHVGKAKKKGHIMIEHPSIRSNRKMVHG